jgi:hypothetical protein
MTTLRALLRDYRTLAMLLVAMALCVKVLVPQGYMVGAEQKLISVQICFDGITHEATQIAIEFDGKSQGTGSGHDSKADAPCAYSSLSMGAMAGADAPLLVIALAFLLALGFAPVRPALRGQLSHILPPLRGPPVVA